MNTITLIDSIEYQRNAVRSNPDQRTYRKVIETESDAAHQATQDLTTSHVALSAGDVSDDAFARIRNLSTTATVEIGGDDSSVFVPWFSIPPGEEATMPRVASLAGTYIRADAPALALVTLYEIVEPTP